MTETGLVKRLKARELEILSDHPDCDAALADATLYREAADALAALKEQEVEMKVTVNAARVVYHWVRNQIKEREHYGPYDHFGEEIEPWKALGQALRNKRRQRSK